MKKRTWFRKFKYALIALVFLACVIVFLEIGEQKNSIIKSWLYGSQATRKLAIATVAMTPDVNPALSLEKMTGFIGRIKEAHPDVDLIFFGEAILGWFKSGNTKYHQDVAEPIPGPTTRLLARLAKDNGVYLSLGMVENRDGQVFNSQVLISDQGEILLTQRKKNVRSEGFSPGRESIALVDIKGVKMGIVVCYDIQSQETLRKAKKNKADVILLSNADYLEKWDKDYFGFRYMAKGIRNSFPAGVARERICASIIPSNHREGL